jgi:hypothetical protein
MRTFQEPYKSAAGLRSRGDGGGRSTAPQLAEPGPDAGGAHRAFAGDDGAHASVSRRGRPHRPAQAVQRLELHCTSDSSLSNGTGEGEEGGAMLSRPSSTRLLLPGSMGRESRSSGTVMLSRPRPVRGAASARAGTAKAWRKHGTPLPSSRGISRAGRSIVGSRQKRYARNKVDGQNLLRLPGHKPEAPASGGVAASPRWPFGLVAVRSKGVDRDRTHPRTSAMDLLCGLGPAQG